LVKALATALELSFQRIQFTPDLMPADIVGTRILEETASGGHAFRFEPGPLFAQLVLADEINRATPRTQSALLEAMQERQVTTFGETRALEEPFCVVATQNPIEMEGTYPLPEAQPDLPVQGRAAPAGASCPRDPRGDDRRPARSAKRGPRRTRLSSRCRRSCARCRSRARSSPRGGTPRPGDRSPSRARARGAARPRPLRLEPARGQALVLLAKARALTRRPAVGDRGGSAGLVVPGPAPPARPQLLKATPAGRWMD
jgi:hypothetical protein